MTIELSKLSNEKPYLVFKNYYDLAIKKNQKHVEAITISSFDKEIHEVQSRIVNLKYVINDEWIFFTNYMSPKSVSFNSHNQISAIFYWNSINTQIRIKAKIKKTSSSFSDEHFRSRSKEKNLLAISSKQSKQISSYEAVLNNYNDVLKNYKDCEASERPSYWGGFSFTPYYFEFWEGNDYRINKREVYSLQEKNWESFFIQP